MGNTEINSDKRKVIFDLFNLEILILTKTMEKTSGCIGYWYEPATFCQLEVVFWRNPYLHSDLKKQSLARISGKHKQFPYFEGASIVRQSPVVEMQLDK